MKVCHITYATYVEMAEPMERRSHAKLSSRIEPEPKTTA